jgi:hypothetical protein
MCAMCNRSPSRDGLPYSSFTAVQFALDAEEEALQREQARQDRVGHPMGLEWFCDEHTAVAEEHSHLHWRAAFDRLRELRG